MDQLIKLLDWMLENWAVLAVAVPVLAGAAGTAYMNFKKASNQSQVINTMASELDGVQKRNVKLKIGNEKPGVQKEYHKSINGR